MALSRVMFNNDDIICIINRVIATAVALFLFSFQFSVFSFQCRITDNQKLKTENYPADN